MDYIMKGNYDLLEKYERLLQREMDEYGSHSPLVREYREVISNLRWSLGIAESEIYPVKDY